MSTSASTQTTVPEIKPGQRSQAWHDLHWLTHAPDLLAPAADLPLASWPPTALREIDRWLQQQGNEGNAPESLASDFGAHYRRLGLYAEALLHTALQHADSIELLAHHTPIHITVSPAPSTGRQTIGELDYIWRDRSNNLVWHWELAVKYYLYVPQASRIQDADRFVGPQQRDTLARKTAKLRDRQLPLSAMPQVTRQLGLRVDAAAAYVKGWLFYPLHGERWDDYVLAEPATRAMLNPLHPKGWWLTQADFAKRLARQTSAGAGTLRWRILSRMQWLSPHQADVADTLEATALLAQLEVWFGSDVSVTGPKPGLLIVALAPSSVGATVSATGAPAPLATGRSSAAPVLVPETGTGQLPQASSGQVYTEVHRGFVVANNWGNAVL
ncbi:DUF1853 family protein [Advenella incenata]